MSLDVTEWKVDAAQTPLVSVLLPTYNRARFLRQAFASIAAQLLRDWELIVVDDGSTDGTRNLVSQLAGELDCPVTYVHQCNQGAYAARQTALEHARGAYYAFYDSDDEWLPHHLQDCCTALEQHPEVSWVYGASRIIDHATGRVLAENSFYENGAPRRFRTLPTRQDGDLHILDAEDLPFEILAGAGLYCGLQNSVIRRSVLESTPIDTSFRNEAEDQLMVIRAAAAGHRFAYYDRVHHVYHVHEQNSSASAIGLSFAKQEELYRALIQGFENLPHQVKLSRRQQRALRQKLSREYFWHLGYATLWSAGKRREAIRAYARGLQLHPLCASYWKTYLWALTQACWPSFAFPTKAPSSS